jgi:hypothetical protein
VDQSCRLLLFCHTKFNAEFSTSTANSAQKPACWITSSPSIHYQKPSIGCTLGNYYGQEVMVRVWLNCLLGTRIKCQNLDGLKWIFNRLPNKNKPAGSHQAKQCHLPLSKIITSVLHSLRRFPVSTLRDLRRTSANFISANFQYF